jgi:hypothetical protein
MRVDGRNNVSMGQFQKGNKLNDEYHDTMANAGLQDRTQALMWENFAMIPIKTMMKSNYLQMTPKGPSTTEQKKELLILIQWPCELRNLNLKLVMDFCQLKDLQELM